MTSTYILDLEKQNAEMRSEIVRITAKADISSLLVQALAKRNSHLEELNAKLLNALKDEHSRSFTRIGNSSFCRLNNANACKVCSLIAKAGVK